MRERKRKSNETQGQAADKYKTKYEKFVGRDAGLEAARIAQPNKQFGFGKDMRKRVILYEGYFISLSIYNLCKNIRDM